MIELSSEQIISFAILGVIIYTLVCMKAGADLFGSEKPSPPENGRIIPGSELYRQMKEER